MAPPERLAAAWTDPVRVTRSAANPTTNAPLTPCDDVLAKLIAYELQETSLRDVIAILGEKTGVNVSIDRRALDDVGIDPETPLTESSTKARPLASVLDSLLDPVDLA